MQFMGFLLQCSRHLRKKCQCWQIDNTRKVCLQTLGFSIVALQTLYIKEFFVLEGSPLTCRMFRSFSGLYPADASSISLLICLFLGQDTPTISRYCYRHFLDGHNYPQFKMTVLEKLIFSYEFIYLIDVDNTVICFTHNLSKAIALYLQMSTRNISLNIYKYFNFSMSKTLLIIMS